ncbi:dTDP-4-dehydrorhamnose 3,5-epimerase [bacterium]|jgi:dTDP-4-dehydrorhamnose 3,5-epimerase|nr:dTDP-4-dehydrorhamnose 3,5-epimerase [bacterium]
MIFEPLRLKGAYLIRMEPIQDNRGWFARTFCQREFEEQGLESGIVQTSVSNNTKKGTLRGMHWQASPYEEVKMIRCTRGRIFDVLVDIRKDSDTFGQWEGFELYPDDPCLLYVPKGFAHGFQTMEDNTDTRYWMAEFYHPEVSMGFRWNDPEVGIQWPQVSERIISEKDKELPCLRELQLS